MVPWEKQFYDPALFNASAGDSHSDEWEEQYFQLIGAKPQKIVEFGCGTGRVILKLAARGHTVTGVDVSKDMLASLRQRITALPAKLKARIKVIHADVLKTKAPGKYQLAIAVDDFLTHFTDHEQLDGVFRRISSWLDGGSFFITDLRIRDREKLLRAESDYPKSLYTYGLVHGVQVNNKVFSASMKFWEDYDAASRVLSSHQVFDFIRQDGVVEKSVYKTLHQKLITKQEIRQIAAAAGFKLHRFIPTNTKKDKNAGIYIFRVNDSTKTPN